MKDSLSVVDVFSMTVEREGYILKRKWNDFSPESPMLVSFQPTENGLPYGEGSEYIKVKIIPYG